MKKSPRFDNSMDESEYENMFRNEETHGWYRGMQNFSQILLEKYLPKKSGLKILDIGCGTGSMLVFLKKYGSTYGIDTSSTAIMFCRRRELTDIQVAGAICLPFPDNNFDLVTCFDVLYISGIDLTKALTESNRVLKGGGLYLLRVPAFDFLSGEHDLVVHSNHRFTRKELEEGLKKHGFEIIFSTYANMFLFFPVWFSRLLSRVTMDKDHPTSDVKPMPRLLNSILETALKIEAIISRYVPLPFGVSVYTVARKM